MNTALYKQQFKIRLKHTLVKLPQIAIILICVCLCPHIAHARETIDNEAANRIDRDMKEILESPEFNAWEIRKIRKWKQNKNDKADKYINNNEFAEINNLLDQTAEIIASVLPWILIISLTVVLIVIIIIKKKNIIDFLRSGKTKKEKYGYVLRGAKPDKSVLPLDIIYKAKQLWKENKPKQALSLIYRGAISYFKTMLFISIPACSTEDECLLQVAARLSGHTDKEKVLSDFSHLIRTWLYSAYANKHPDTEDFNSLCHHWDKYFKDQE